jgi:hypothetical protein
VTQSQLTTTCSIALTSRNGGFTLSELVSGLEGCGWNLLTRNNPGTGWFTTATRCRGADVNPKKESIPLLGVREGRRRGSDLLGESRAGGAGIPESIT